MQEALAKYGTPEIVNIDQGSQFTAKEFNDGRVGQSLQLVRG